MKLRLFFISILLCSMQSLFAQDSLTISYRFVISFGSECCGVPSETALTKAIASFKKKYKVKKIAAIHVGPTGREGEYFIAFPLTELNKVQVKKFISCISSIKKLPDDAGYFRFTENKKVEPGSFPKRTVSKPVEF